MLPLYLFFYFLVRQTSCHYQEIWTSLRSIVLHHLIKMKWFMLFLLLYWVLLSWITFCNGDLFDSESVSSASPDEMWQVFSTLYSWWIVTLCPNQAQCDKQFLSTLKMKLRYDTHFKWCNQRCLMYCYMRWEFEPVRFYDEHSRNRIKFRQVFPF